MPGLAKVALPIGLAQFAWPSIECLADWACDAVGLSTPARRREGEVLPDVGVRAHACQVPACELVVDLPLQRCPCGVPEPGLVIPSEISVEEHADAVRADIDALTLQMLLTQKLTGLVKKSIASWAVGSSGTTNIFYT